MPETSTFVPIGWDASVAATQYGNLTAPQKWDVNAMTGVFEKDTLAALEGADESAFVITKREFAGDGYIMNMRTKTGFYGEGVRGGDTFTSNDQFEKRRYGQYGVLIGVHRHASSSNEELEIGYALDGEVGDGTALEEGRWMGRRNLENGLMTIRERCAGSSRRWCGNRSLETLRSTDYLDRNEIVISNGAMKNIGGGRTDASTDPAQIMMRTLALCPSVVMTRLKLDPAYQKMVEQATARGAGNYLFRGDVIDMDHTLFHEHDSLYHDGDGPLGSVLAPFGVLADPITAADTAIDINFGLKTPNVYYSKWFPGYGGYSFQKTDTLMNPSAVVNQYLTPYVHGTSGITPNLAGGGEHYLMVVIPSTDATAPNNVGYFAYDVGNDGKKITITRRLSATNGTYQKQTLASNTSLGYVANGGQNIAVWGNGFYGSVKLAEAFPAGSLVFPCNSKGVPFGYVPLLGKGALYRGYGKYKCKRGFQEEEDGFVKKAYTRGYIGHRCRHDFGGRTPGIILIGCAINDPALPIPQVTQ